MLSCKRLTPLTNKVNSDYDVGWLEEWFYLTELSPYLSVVKWKEQNEDTGKDIPALEIWKIYPKN